MSMVVKRLVELGAKVVAHEAEAAKAKLEIEHLLEEIKKTGSPTKVPEAKKPGKAKKRRTREEVKTRILLILKNKQPRSANAIANACEASLETAKAAIDEMVKEGTIRTTKVPKPDGFRGTWSEEQYVVALKAAA